jgi:hypothetical protein
MMTRHNYHQDFATALPFQPPNRDAERPSRAILEAFHTLAIGCRVGLAVFTLPDEPGSHRAPFPLGQYS